MPATYRIDTKRRLVIARVAGHVTESDLLEYQDSLRRDPHFRADFDQVLDLRGSERLDVTRAGICFAALRSPFGATSRRAVLSTTAGARELARVFGLWSDGLTVRTRLFSAPGPALVWLGIPDDDVVDAERPWYPVISALPGLPTPGPS
jgi:hypothetical protein